MSTMSINAECAIRVDSSFAVGCRVAANHHQITHAAAAKSASDKLAVRQRSPISEAGVQRYRHIIERAIGIAGGQSRRTIRTSESKYAVSTDAQKITNKEPSAWCSCGIQKIRQMSTKSINAEC